MPAQAPELQHKTIHMSNFKALDDEQGVFEGYLAVFGNVDSYGDVIERGAFKKTLAEAEKKRSQRGDKYLFPILWQHSPEEPIGGFLEMREDDFGLYVKGQLDLDIELGRRAYSGLKKGYIRGLSIGYDVVKQAWDGQIRRLKEINLWEGSVVTFPANPEANVERVKAQKGGESVGQDAMEFKAVGGRTDWPLANRDRPWDADKARKRLVEWATDEDGNLDAAKMRSVHFWYDPEKPDNVTAYKLPFCDVIDGKVMAIPRAIFTVAAVLQGARGGVDIPEEDKAKIRRKVEAYYARMRKEFNDDTIQVPWSKAATFAGALAHNNLWSRWENLFSTLREYVLHVLTSSDRDDKLADIRQGVDEFRDAFLQWAQEAVDAGFPLMPDGGILLMKADDTNRAKIKDAVAVLQGAVKVLQEAMVLTGPKSEKGQLEEENAAPDDGPISEKVKNLLADMRAFTQELTKTKAKGVA